MSNRAARDRAALINSRLPSISSEPLGRIRKSLLNPSLNSRIPTFDPMFKYDTIYCLFASFGRSFVQKENQFACGVSVDRSLTRSMRASNILYLFVLTVSLNSFLEG